MGRHRLWCVGWPPGETENVLLVHLAQRHTHMSAFDLLFDHGGVNCQQFPINVSNGFSLLVGLFVELLQMHAEVWNVQL